MKGKLVILVTGSSGFAGEVLIPKLKKKEFEIIGLDWKKGKYTDLIQDISKPFDIEKKIDVIIHLAARLEHDRCSKEEYYSGNVLGTENVLKIAKKHQSYFIYVSTTAIYGSPTSPITEQTPIDPDGYYALTKWEGEKICQRFEKEGMTISIVRPSVLIGKKRLGIFKIIFKNLVKNSRIPLLGDGKNKISFVHIDDITDFLVYLTQLKIKKLVVNFGGVVPGDLNYVIDELKKYTNSKSKILHVSLKWKPFLTVLAKLKFLPVTSWQLSVMHKDYFYENKILFSTGYRYKNNPIGALKSMVDYYHNMII